MKRTPLKRGSSLLRRTPMPQPTQPIRHRSAKRVREDRQRAAMLAPRRAEQQWCGRCGRPTTELDGHELLSRARGGSITDPANVVLICRYPCHHDITTNPALAESEGWSLSQYGGTR